VSGRLSLSREPYLLLRFQERHLPDLSQVHPHRIIRDPDWNLARSVSQFLFLNFLQLIRRGFIYFI